MFKRNQQSWQSIPIQINKGNREGALDFNIQENSGEKNLRPFDRIALHPNHFGDLWDQKGVLPCKTSHLGSQISSSGRHAYLFFCEEEALAIPSDITYDEKLREVHAPGYHYIHDEYNHLSFDAIKLEFGNKHLPIALDAEQLIRADVKNFFTMDFDAGDIRANLSHQLPGSVGLLGLLRFYLKILFFKIELALTPEVQFYEDSLYMPMSLHSPVEADSYLNPGSGIFYTWKSPKDVSWDFDRSRMPRFIAKEVYHKDWKAYCGRKRCAFTLVGNAYGRSIGMDFQIDRRLAEMNFYPQLITDMNVVNRSFDDKISEDLAYRIGVFFETSRLPKGDHFWDFWISLNRGKAECPAPLRLKSLRKKG